MKNHDAVLPQLLLSQLGDRLRHLRKEKGIGTEALCAAVGISRPTLRAVEAGDPGTAIGIYLRVMTALGVGGELSLLASGAMGPLSAKTAAGRSKRTITPLKVSIEADRSSSELNDMQSLALHRAAMQAIKENPELLKKAQLTLQRWQQNQPDSRSYVLWDEWGRLLTTPRNWRFVTSRSAHAQQLRQTSPLTTVLSDEQRSAILNEFRNLKQGIVLDDMNRNAPMNRDELEHLIRACGTQTKE